MRDPEKRTASFYIANPTRLKEDLTEVYNLYPTPTMQVLMSYIQILKDENDRMRRLVRELAADSVFTEEDN